MSKRERWSWKDQTFAFWYKWEFLRRNVKYAAEIEAFESFTAEWCVRNGNLHKQIDARTEADWKVFCVTIAPEMERISRAWKVTQPTSPTWNYSKKHGFLITSHPGIEGRSLPFEDSEDAWRVWDIEYEPPAENEEEWDRRFMRETAEIGDLEKESPTTLDLEQLNEPRKCRRRFDDFDIQLKAWDLRHDGHSVSEIAKLMYPREFEAYRHTASSDNIVFRRVRDQISRAQKRIDGGYTAIM
jgi:hypothetical protein